MSTEFDEPVRFKLLSKVNSNHQKVTCPFSQSNGSPCFKSLTSRTKRRSTEPSAVSMASLGRKAVSAMPSPRLEFHVFHWMCGTIQSRTWHRAMASRCSWTGWVDCSRVPFCGLRHHVAPTNGSIEGLPVERENCQKAVLRLVCLMLRRRGSLLHVAYALVRVEAIVLWKFDLFFDTHLISRVLFNDYTWDIKSNCPM